MNSLLFSHLKFIFDHLISYSSECLIYLGPLKSVPEKAKRHINEARAKAMRRFKKAKNQLSDRLKNLVEDDLDFEIDGIVSPTRSEPGTPTEERDSSQGG